MSKIFKRAVSGIVMGVAAFVLTTAPASAALTHTTIGDATLVSPGNASDTAAQLVSDTVTVGADGFGGLDFELPADTAFSSLTTLSTDYNVTDDDCGVGSPRFQLNIDTNNDGVSDGNVHVAIGPSPNFVDCLSGWQNTGNLIGNNDTGRYDFGQFGGSPFATYVDAPANVLAGEVVGIQLVADGGWNVDASGGDGEQTILVDNVVINNDTETFETEEEPTMPTTKDECKKGGWETFGVFKNQGDCVSWVATGGRNLPAVSAIFRF